MCENVRCVCPRERVCMCVCACMCECKSVSCVGVSAHTSVCGFEILMRGLILISTLSAASESN